MLSTLVCERPVECRRGAARGGRDVGRFPYNAALRRLDGRR